MSRPSEEKFDLLVVVADLDQEEAMLGLLPRHQSLNTSPFTFKVTTLPDTPGDAGTRKNGPEYLRTIQHTFDRAIVLFDRHGAGADHSAERFENDLEVRLNRNGLGGRTRCIVIDPELEAWVWSTSPHVSTVLNHPSHSDLTNWLKQENWLKDGQLKPSQPKEALHAAFCRKPLAPFFKQLARKVSFQNCQDRAFNRLLHTLRTWFPVSTPEVHP